MNRRLVPAAVLLSLAVTASAAHATTLAPATGTWKGKAADSAEGVSFRLEKRRGAYRAASTALRVDAQCTPSDPNAAVSIRTIRARGVTVKLSGGAPQGSHTIITKSGKATTTVRVAVKFVSSRRAKVTVSGRYVTAGDSTPCNGKVTVTARKAAAPAKTVTVGQKSSGHTLHVGRGTTLRVRLEDSPSTGTFWSVTTKPSRSVLTTEASKIVSPNGKKDKHGNVLVGAPATHYFIWKARAAGSTTIALKQFGPASKKALAAVHYKVVVR